MKEITVSEKLRGARRWAAVERARKRIKSGEAYLIRRHGARFRPGFLSGLQPAASACRWQPSWPR